MCLPKLSGKPVTRILVCFAQGGTFAPLIPKTIPMRDDRENLIVELTIEFTTMIIEFSEKLEELRKFVIARQLLRAGASIGSNVWEAQNGESKADFIHKFKIAAKEADETTYWLTVCERAKTYPNPESQIITRLNDIKRIISKIISSSKNN